MTAVAIKEALKSRAADFVRYYFPAGRLNGSEWQVGSLNGEQGKSLCIRIDGAKVGIFKDFATDDAGDNLVELYAQAKAVPFKDALRACADWLGVPLDCGSRSKPTVAYPAPKGESSPLAVPMSDSDNQRALSMAATLRDNPALCERLARARGWQPETILNLAHEPSLGWDDGKLAFLYESGVKRRWREDGERVIKWAFGRPWLWRGGYLWGKSTIYLCEGETDAISLIDGGLEKDSSTLAVALPSASTFEREWATLFKDKDVVLALDGDNAGLAATARIASFLQPVVKSLKQLNWEGLQHAS